MHKFLFHALLLTLILVSGCSSTKKTSQTSTEKPSRENDLVIRNIELIQQGEENFLKLSIEERNPEARLYPYPLFRIESGGKVVAERGLSTYGLVETELVPTSLESLPKDFKCTVFLEAYGDMAVPKYELPYPAPKN